MSNSQNLNSGETATLYRYIHFTKYFTYLKVLFIQYFSVKCSALLNYFVITPQVNLQKHIKYSLGSVVNYKKI